MESSLPISFLNDFIFCPRSIYFHQLYGKVAKEIYHSSDQVNGLNAHQSVDQKKYSHRTTVLQGLEVYSEQYGLVGKIDLYHQEKALLSERKKKIKTIYDGYIFQLYAQYFGLTEMGYSVQYLNLYSLDDNKTYPVQLPHQNPEKLSKFKALIQNIRSFDLTAPFTANPNKCTRCIYQPLCDQAKPC